MKRLGLMLFREQQHLKQYEMAEKLGITRQHYNRLELGKNEPSIGLVEKFSNEFPDAPDVWEIFKKK